MHAPALDAVVDMNIGTAVAAGVATVEVSLDDSGVAGKVAGGIAENDSDFAGVGHNAACVAVDADDVDWRYLLDNDLGRRDVHETSQPSHPSIAFDSFSTSVTLPGM